MLCLAITGAHADADPLLITAALSLTGPGDFYGVPALDGVRLAVEEANAIRGAPRIALAVSDDRSSPDGAAALAHQLGAGTSVVVVGPSLTVSGMMTGPVYAQAGLVSIVPTAHGDDVPSAATTFQPIFNTGTMGSALAEFLLYSLDGRRAVVLFRDDAFGRPISEGFRRTATQLGLQASFHGFSSDSARAATARLAAAEPDQPAIVLGMLASDAVPLLTDLRRAGVTAPILAPSALAGDNFADLFALEPEEGRIPGFFTNNLYAASPIMFDSADSETLAFAKRFHDRFGKDPSWTAVQGYDATRLAIAAARHAANARDLKARRTLALDYLATLNGPDHALAGVTGPLWFTAQRGREQPVRVGRFQDKLFESAPIQLVPARSFDPADLASGAVIDRGDGRFIQRQLVVFTGVFLNEVSRLDIAQSRFTADVYFWLRYPFARGGASADPEEIAFPDVIRGSSDGKQPARAGELEDGWQYRLWRLRGDFRNEFDLRRFPVDRQTLSVRFFNAQAASDRIVYAQDRHAPPSEATGPDGRMLAATGADTFRALPQWQPLQATEGRDTLVTRSGLGNPRLIGLEQVRELSGFRIDVEMRRRVLPTLLKNLLPLGLMTLIVYSTLHFPPHLLKEKVTVTVTGALSGAVLLASINSQLGGVGYVIAVEYLFYLFFALCLCCIVSFVTTERLRVAKRNVPVARIERLSRCVYLGSLSVGLVTAWAVGARWYDP